MRLDRHLGLQESVAEHQRVGDGDSRIILRMAEENRRRVRRHVERWIICSLKLSSGMFTDQKLARTGVRYWDGHRDHWIYGRGDVRPGGKRVGAVHGAI